MTTVPTWAALAVSVGTPVLTFLGVLIAQRVTRVGTRELEIRSKREETMRNLRWAAELAVAEDSDKARLGVAELRALAGSALLDDDEQVFIDAAMAAVVREPVAEIAEAGEAAQVVPVAVDAVVLSTTEADDRSAP